MKNFGEQLSQAAACQDAVQQTKMYESLAKQGCTEAQYHLAVNYYEGRGVEKDVEMSIGWLRHAAAQGDEDAAAFLGGLLLHSEKAEDVAEGEQRCLAAMARGDVIAHLNLGNFYYAQDRDAEAVPLFRYAADAGFTPAVFKLGLCHYFGQGTAENEAAAFQLFREAAQQGHAAAAYYAAQCCYHGQGTPENRAEGDRWLAQAIEGEYGPALLYRGERMVKQAETQEDGVRLLTRAAELGEDRAMFILYCHFTDRKDDTTAQAWLRRAAEAGNREAQCDLGYYLTEQERSPEEQEEGRQWMQRGAEQGDTIATYNMGLHFEQHPEQPDAKQQAFSYMARAAERDYMPAIYRLAMYYFEGTGVRRNRRKALATLRYAADGGYTSAAYSYGSILLEGDGVPQDIPTALRYLRRALAGNSGAAAYRLGLCYAEGTGVPEDHAKFLSLMRKAVRLGAAERVYDLAHALRKQEAYEDAYRLYSFVAERGYTGGIWHQAHLLHLGLGCEQDDKAALALFLKGAKKGDPDSMESAARLTEKAGAFPQAFRLWQKAAAAGSEEGAFKVAYCYDVGQGVRKNQVKANTLYHALLEKSPHDAAANNLGYNYLYGQGTEENNDMAFRYLSLAVQEGSKNALLLLGRCYRHGWGTEPDINEAIRLLKAAAKEGLTGAMQDLGFIYYGGEGAIPRDFRAAARWWRMGAEHGDAKCMYELGLCFRDGEGVRRSYRDAVAWWRKGAELSHSDCIGCLGWCAFHGKGVKRDDAAAVGYFRRALELDDDCVSAYNLAKRLYHGQGTEQNYEEALAYFRLSAKQQYPDAIGMLGLMYEKGHAVTKDIRKALTLYRRAAKLGSEDACYELGRCYEHGIGVSPNRKRAMELYRQAADKNCAAAKRALKRLERKG